ncbi:hypothetical protein [Paraburkholderia ribeironis]|uniref:hypothetical protein n=1 Tax=Paraburkholderia ribeironis TaxID=1247936 RepID=UPI001FEC548B|nr:hypothetical protein [Paraburkholderia ribeironis]
MNTSSAMTMLNPINKSSTYAGSGTISIPMTSTITNSTMSSGRGWLPANMALSVVRKVIQGINLKLLAAFHPEAGQ